MVGVIGFETVDHSKDKLSQCKSNADKPRLGKNPQFPSTPSQGETTIGQGESVEKYRIRNALIVRIMEELPKMDKEELEKVLAEIMGKRNRRVG